MRPTSVFLPQIPYREPRNPVSLKLREWRHQRPLISPETDGRQKMVSIKTMVLLEIRGFKIHDSGMDVCVSVFEGGGEGAVNTI